MHLILTHEQADFDAIAATLGAHLISKDTTPILPIHLNRNVRTFLNLYGGDLPFTLISDLPRTPIEKITLVDTQSLISVKGMSRETKISVIDHHPKRNDLPIHWSFTECKTGACTTHFVEKITAQKIQLNISEATLLLLGIYEDTGSLTFISTTPQDIFAAATLLENGASLTIANKYLNPPLSDKQRALFDELLKNSSSQVIHGKKTIISYAEAMELTEEISSVAHKLCDLLDPDALFIFVYTQEGIRLVARSFSDQINVAKITARYGGGGHSRAAAALIHPNKKNDGLILLKELILDFSHELPYLVLPAYTVEQIMSKQPLTIKPETSAKEAGKLMQRFGYEGYPVVKNKKVIGLLTRRAVDRALSHKLDLPAISLMEAGSISVRPTDSLEKLQYIMASSGWGQVPVVDDSSNEVIGIVTRTDLLKTLAGNNGYTVRINLSKELAEVLTPAKLSLLKLIAQHATQEGMPIYIVGGVVRDILLERPGKDVDFVIEGDAITLTRSLVNHFGGKITSHKQFGTAKWFISDIYNQLIDSMPKGVDKNANNLPNAIDLISARTEFYSYPTALPTIKKGSIKSDLQRRDFSINTMAIRLDGDHYGDLYDFWGGWNDLKQGLIRVLHSLSFVDDPTRMLRAVRFEQRLHFNIEERTLQLLMEARSLLEQISGDRIRHELDLILDGGECGSIMQRLHDLGLLKMIHPDFQWTPEISTLTDSIFEKPLKIEWDLPEILNNVPVQRILAYTILFSRLPPHVVGQVVKRLRLPSFMRKIVIDHNSLFHEFPRFINYQVSKIVKRLENVHVVGLYALSLTLTTPEAKEQVRNYYFKWRMIKPYTTGETLKNLNIHPGPIYKKILNSLRSAWLDGKVTSKKEEEDLLRNLILDNKDLE